MTIGSAATGQRVPIYKAQPGAEVWPHISYHQVARHVRQPNASSAVQAIKRDCMQFRCACSQHTACIQIQCLAI